MLKQQDMVKQACMVVLGRVPTRGADAKEAFTAEVREKIANYMLPLLGVEWKIDSENTKARAREYITGKQNTDLLQNWTFEKKKVQKAAPAAAAPAGQDKVDLIKASLAAGLITKEFADARLAELKEQALAEVAKRFAA